MKCFPQAAVVTALALTLPCTEGGSQSPCGPLHYGAPSAGSGGFTPQVSARGGAPTLGNVGYALDVDGVVGGALLGRLIGFTPISAPVLGIELLVDPVATTLGTASGTGAGAGRTSFPLPIPNAANLVGLTAYAQVLVIDNGAVAGIAASDGLQIRICADNLLCSSAAYQGAARSDAFSAITALGGGRILAGKRSSGAANRFLLSDDDGQTWSVVGCPGSTGAHTYFFGQNGDTVLSGTGDTGNACLMRSDDRGLRWSVLRTSAQLRALAGSANVESVFGTVHLGGGRWLVNLKCRDTATKVIASNDDGLTWFAPPAQPGQRRASWARQMIRTADDVLLWPEVLTDQIFVSRDLGASWSAATVPGASLFQPLCDAGSGVYLCGDASASPNATLGLHRSLDQGRSWTTVTTVNLQRPTTTYWRDVLAVDGTLFASACCREGNANERFMQLFRSTDGGASWCSYGNPYVGPFGGMQAIYQMCTTGSGSVFAACQPDSTILRWPVETWR